MKLKGNGMNSLAVVEREAAATQVKVTEDKIIVSLVDGRVISIPIPWYPRLLHGTAEERNQYGLMGRGTGIHWPMLDEDISVSGLLKGNPSFESERSLQNWLEKRTKRE